MICVFGIFVLGDQRVLKMFGLGLAAAVLVDATIVRMVLVPATMELLGDRQLVVPAAGSTGSCPALDVEGPVDEDEIDEIDLTDRPAPAEEPARDSLVD